MTGWSHPEQRGVGDRAGRGSVREWSLLEQRGLVRGLGEGWSHPEQRGVGDRGGRGSMREWSLLE